MFHSSTTVSTLARLTTLAGLLAIASVPRHAAAQGCVIARGGGGAMVLGGDGFLESGDWQLNLAYRYFHSDRHFVGDVEQTHRQEEGSQVDNYSHFIDLTATYAVNRRLWLNLTLPFVSHERSSLYEHDRTNRHSTYAAGLADLRLTSTFWLLDPETHHRGNFSIGAGVKAPTGDYTAADVFHRPGGPELRYVDSSIQPGDGGWGAVLEAQGFFAFTETLSAYANGFYQVNPREQVEETGFSVPDGYLARAGANYVVWPSQGLSLSLGGRIEGVPPTDLVGGDLGRRRPGYSVAVEPGVSWARGRYFASLTAPVAVYRNRQQSHPESLVGRHGDAAFADFSINLGFSVRF
ncbi:MAG TPA: hypothetical protein DCY13_10145 [Verrucomicrobiales bacterium]|nr:hypothetical protein [Verrucomicrobiales bacterium]